MNRNLLVAVAAAGLFGVHAAQAATAWDEAASGDLSNNGLAPTAISVVIGSNLVIGTAGNGGSGVDRDYFSFSVPAGARMTAIDLNPGSTISGGSAFFAIQAGTQVTVTPSGGGAQALIGYVHYGNEDIGHNVLPLILGPNSPFGSELPSGTYSFWVQDTGSTVDYNFTFQLAPVPELPTLWMVGLGAIAVSLRRRLR